jgi:hypothetical protein
MAWLPMNPDPPVTRTVLMDFPVGMAQKMALLERFDRIAD